MSVLIKGMSMPKRCEDCLLCEEIGGLGCRVQHLVILRRHGQEKPSWCPLVEVPTKHGRLIDADSTLERMWNALYALEDKREEQHGLDVIERVNIQDGFEAGQRVVADAPTVIEAEE